jgi:hypothetical protein
MNGINAQVGIIARTENVRYRIVPAQINVEVDFPVRMDVVSQISMLKTEDIVMNGQNALLKLSVIIKNVSP